MERLNDMAKEMPKFDRIIGLDFLRVFAACMVCAFHTVIHLGVKYGVFQYFVASGAVFMTLFFMLSGYVLYLKYTNMDFLIGKHVLQFWAGRFLAIVPMFYLITALDFVFQIVQGGDALKRVLLLPAALLGITANYTSLFDYIDWFVPCLLMSYLFFPLLQVVTKTLKDKSRLRFLLVLVFLVLYSNLLVKAFDLSNIYSNAFVRGCEFAIGTVLASFQNRFSSSRFVNRFLYRWKTVFLLLLFLAACITCIFPFADRSSVSFYMNLNYICVPIFMLLLIACTGVHSEALNASRVFSYSVNLTYCFFLAQFFSNSICKYLFLRLDIVSNLPKLLSSWIICIFLAIILHECIEKKLKKTAAFAKYLA